MQFEIQSMFWFNHNYISYKSKIGMIYIDFIMADTYKTLPTGWTESILKITSILNGLVALHMLKQVFLIKSLLKVVIRCEGFDQYL